jgi:hypothetical protein
VKLDIFADGIANVSVGTGVVRIDFFVARAEGPPAAPGDTSNMRRDVHLSVNVPLPTFVNSMNVLQALMNQLIQDGVVHSGQGEPAHKLQ